MTVISFKRGKNSLKAGDKIVSYPDHKGESKEGFVTEITEKHITVDYPDTDSYDLGLDGKLFPDIDTNLDINLIII